MIKNVKFCGIDLTYIKLNNANNGCFYAGGNEIPYIEIPEKIVTENPDKFDIEYESATDQDIKKVRNKKNISIVVSETWQDLDVNEIQNVLTETLEDFVNDEKIINIEIKEHNGLERFWIYIEEK